MHNMFVYIRHKHMRLPLEVIITHTITDDCYYLIDSVVVFMLCYVVCCYVRSFNLSCHLWHSFGLISIVLITIAIYVV